MMNPYRETNQDRSFEWEKSNKYHELMESVSNHVKLGSIRMFADIVCAAYFSEYEGVKDFMIANDLDESHVYAYMDMDDELQDYLWKQSEEAKWNFEP